MLIDIHTHLFPDRIAARTIAFLEDTCGQKACHDGTSDGLMRELEKADVTIGVAMPVVTKPEQFASINRFAKEVTDRYQGHERRIVSFGGIHPDTDDYRRDLDEIKAMGFPGVKIHPAYQGVFISDKRNLQILEYAQEIGLWVMVHAGFDPYIPETDYCSPKEALSVIHKVGGDHVILAHMGGLNKPDEVMEYLIGEDVWIDTSIGFAFMNESQMTEMVREHGADRVLFGSDSPWSDCSEVSKKLRNLPLTDEELELICWKNARRIIGNR